MLELLKNSFSGKRVFLTGHTGFKGSWLLQILRWLGAEVKGFSLAPENSFDLYNEIQGDELCYASVIGDIRDLHLLQGEMVRFEPQFVFHLAAQSLVRRSYKIPVDTFAVNTLGTAHVLEAMKALSKPCVGVIITTDKVYENAEKGIAFREEDKLGGYDPYSASKAAAEIVIDSYRRSFFPPDKFSSHEIALSSVRAGNVIGGGDYAKDRIIPDIVFAMEREEKVVLRNPGSVRPWQHVLEPLGAYLLLAACMAQDPLRYSSAYNIGPEKEDEKTVEELTNIFLNAIGKPGCYEIQQQEHAPHEAGFLMLDNTKFRQTFDWHPKLNAQQAIEWTAQWYFSKQPAREKCLEQIKQYFEAS